MGTIDGTAPISEGETEPREAAQGSKAAVNATSAPESGDDHDFDETDRTGANKTSIGTAVSVPEFSEKMPDRFAATALEGPGIENSVGYITISDFGKEALDQSNSTGFKGHGLNDSTASNVTILEEEMPAEEDLVENKSPVALLEESATPAVSLSLEEGDITQKVNIVSIREQSLAGDVHRQRLRAHRGSLRGRRKRKLQWSRQVAEFKTTNLVDRLMFRHLCADG